MLGRAKLHFTSLAGLKTHITPFVPKYIPDELYGAFNAIAACFPKPRPYLERRLAGRAAVSDSISLSEDYRPVRPFEQDLDFKAHLSILSNICCWVIPAIAFAYFGRPSGEAPSWPAVMLRCIRTLLLCILSFTFSVLIRYGLKENQYKKHQYAASQLGDSDSRFCKVGNISVHYKSCTPVKRAAQGTTDREMSVKVALYHGFGANLWMWRTVQQQIANVLETQVVAHDMPGFGLTERAQSLYSYTLKTNGDIGRALCAKGPDGSNASRYASSRQGKDEGVDPVVLVGHSLGGAGVARSFAANRDNVAAIVLVAPAIMVSPFSMAAELKDRSMITDAPEGCHCLRETYTMQDQAAPRPSESTNETSAQASTESASSTPYPTPSSPSTASAEASESSSAEAAPLPYSESAWLARFRLGSVFKRCGRALLAAFFIVFRPVLFTVLRAVVRSKAFWAKGLKSAYADPTRLSEQTTYYYRLPALVRGWESGIVRFLQARLMSDEDSKGGSRRDEDKVIGSYGVNFYTASGSTMELETKQPGLLQDFERAVKESGIPVLIVHGEQDRLVPIGNSCRLSAVLGGAPVVKIAGCGHNPMEEMSECFVSEPYHFCLVVVYSSAPPPPSPGSAGAASADDCPRPVFRISLGGRVQWELWVSASTHCSSGKEMSPSEDAETGDMN